MSYKDGKTVNGVKRSFCIHACVSVSIWLPTNNRILSHGDESACLIYLNDALSKPNHNKTILQLNTHKK